MLVYSFDFPIIILSQIIKVYSKEKNYYTTLLFILLSYIMISTPLILWALLILFGWAIVAIYNKLISMKNTVDNAISDIDVQMKKRFDLVDNLVNTVKWYASHEKETLTQLTAARAWFMNATDTEEKLEANNQLTSTLKTLFAVSEAYPDLKANAGFLSLQSQLSALEESIASARRYLNATIREYNIALQSFPNNLIASIFGFKNQTNYFEVTNEEEKKAPKVQF